jgi:hypothetical protein
VPILFRKAEVSVFSKVLLWMFLVALPCATHANLRGPIDRQPEASSALKQPAPDLMVEYENLSFDLGVPYSGDARAVLDETRVGKVEAEYVLQAESEARHTFEFIMPQPNPVQVSINGEPILADTPVREPHDGSEAGRAELWRAVFTGTLRQGRNTIRVSYQQPLGLSETDYGYFVSSKWETFLEYELWPLKAWKLAPGFRINVEISVDDDTFVLKRWIASRHTVMALALLPVKRGEHTFWDEFELSGGQVERPSGKIKRSFILGPRFPDRLRVLSTEYIRRQYEPYLP